MRGRDEEPGKVGVCWQFAATQNGIRVSIFGKGFRMTVAFRLCSVEPTSVDTIVVFIYSFSNATSTTNPGRVTTKYWYRRTGPFRNSKSQLLYKPDPETRRFPKEIEATAGAK